ncbi:MutS-related protein [Niabella terrae]
MQIDEVSFNDIAIFHPEEEQSVFHRLDFTRTEGGKNWLKVFFNQPHNDIQQIKGTQQILRELIAHIDDWPEEISNGTILVMYKFLDYALDNAGEKPSALNALMYRMFHSADYSMVRFSIKHFVDFFRGIDKIRILLDRLDLPVSVRIYIDRIHQLLKIQPFLQMAEIDDPEAVSRHKKLYFAAAVRGNYKRQLLELIDIYSRLDGWYSMAMATKVHQLHFPEFVVQDHPMIEAQGLYHILLQHPVPYHLQMSPHHNFLFLTGANMAGKSTLIKSVGTAVFLAHLGMGVPAASMKLTLFDGLISNINVVDNIIKGESYFFNEVQRVKNTVEKISDGRKWLVLIDELFKGTNMQDAMRCSLAVINGLIKVKSSLFILSTHLYEIGEELQEQSHISFRHFKTTVTEDALQFSYQLKEGISRDRLGYLILKRENVVQMLQEL